jgi:thymidylate synthase
VLRVKENKRQLVVLFGNIKIKIMNKIDKDYTNLLQDILDNGVKKETRNGSTISVFGRQIRHKMSEGFPLLTTKKMYTKGIIAELLWFLRGDTNIKSLLDNDCHIWDGDAYKAYEKKALDVIGENEKDKLLSKEEFINKIKTDDEFAKKWGELGPIYGKQWRSWERYTPYQKIGSYEDGIGVYTYKKNTNIDQIANLINDLKTNPDSRRLMVNAWNVGELDSMTLPPCHYGFQIYTRELSVKERLFFVNQSDDEYNKALSNKEQYKSIGLDFELALTSCMDKLNIPTRAISLMWNQRSVDTFLGLPFNIASYGLLLEIIAKVVNMVPDELIGNLGDVHLYSNHVDQALEQIGRYLEVDERVCMCYENPKLDLSRIQEGMSDSEFTKVCDEFGIPTRTRVPFDLPKLGFNKSSGFFRELGDDLSLLNHLDISDFMVENYQSHSTIKAPLSN